MRLEEIKSLVRAVGPRASARVIGDLLEGRDANGREVPKLKPEDFSLRALWEAYVGPVGETLEGFATTGRFNFVQIQEAIDSSMFPSATGVLIAAKVTDGYTQVPTIGDRLVGTMSSKLKSERIVGFTSLEGPLEVKEAMPYEGSSFTEKYVITETAKKGRILDITEEAIFFDQTGQILRRAGQLGELTAQERELTILSGVVDVGSGANGYKDVYRPTGVATALYSAGNTNYLATATPLVDWTDIDEVLLYAAQNIRDDRLVPGERLPVLFTPRVILTGQVKRATSARILSATEQRSQPSATDASQVVIGGNPVTGTNGIAPGLVALSSPLLDYLAQVAGSRHDDAKDWWIGDPQRQFVWQEIWPLQTLRAQANDENQFRRDIVAGFKVRYYGGIAATDTKLFIKVNDT